MAEITGKCSCSIVMVAFETNCPLVFISLLLRCPCCVIVLETFMTGIYAMCDMLSVRDNMSFSHGKPNYISFYWCSKLMISFIFIPDSMKCQIGDFLILIFDRLVVFFKFIFDITECQISHFFFIRPWHYENSVGGFCFPIILDELQILNGASYDIT